MVPTPSPFPPQGTAFDQDQGSCTAKKFIGAVEDEWLLFRFERSVTTQSLRSFDAFHPLTATAPWIIPSVHL
jgi:EAL domain-containing protein (putative c-di-GMP-specific phosphodiesterase class I)